MIRPTQQLYQSSSQNQNQSQSQTLNQSQNKKLPIKIRFRKWRAIAQAVAFILRTKKWIKNR